VARSKATDSPIWPAFRLSWKKAFDASAVEKPAYCRIVQGRFAYMVARGPRRNGKAPGMVSLKDSASRSAAV